MNIRTQLTDSDKPGIKQLLEGSGFFYPFEVDIVMDIADETISKGDEASGYYWLLLEENGQLEAFANFGPNPSSVHSWDLYWLAVDRQKQNKKLGTALLGHTEEIVREAGGKILWIETAGRPLYKPTVEFYLRRGYTLHASLPEFYGPGDPKLIFSRIISA